MEIGLYRYGEGAHLVGLCLGVARHPPRGVRRESWTERGFFDLWLRQLAPSATLVAAYRDSQISFAIFARRYRGEMQTTDTQHLIAFIATIAQNQRINLGCFCADPARCHRSVLRELITGVQDSPRPHRALTQRSLDFARACASPPCAMPEISD